MSTSTRWTDLAQWLGPVPGRYVGGMSADCRGLVVHIASGGFDGTITWQRNPVSKVSSHFVVGRDGQIVQMVDTADASWAQEAGNRTWLSIENEGRVKGDPGYRPGLEVLTDAQLAANAQLLAYAHRVLRIPLQLATTPAGRGLGHHSMGADWGHQSCPGTPIIAQKPEIVRRAIAIVNGEDDMAGFDASDAHYLLTYKGLPADAPTMSLGSAALSAQKHAASADAKLDGLMVKVDALTAAVHVLAAGGTDVDTHAVIAAINAVGDRQTQTVANLQARLAAAEAASAAALAAGPPAGS